ncbi:MAG: TVP38/TMEM64 family protein [Deltaproteobacteria bacterium]|jgi:uncharacterized membrane protein YdjX (TVP38/TMEM64 family)|nr:TVP38/TMEM64 family protein [Deltaproteobacteria bacterium]
MTSTLRRSLVALAIVALALAVGSWLRGELGLELDVASLREFAQGLGPAAPILFVGLVAFRAALALPSQVVLIAAGLCFGTGIGTLVGGTGLLISGLGLFCLARYAGRDVVEERLGQRFARLLDLAGRRAGALALALGSSYPIAPLSPIQAAAGLTPMSVMLFLVAAFAGALARAAAFAFFGNALMESSLSAILYATLAFAAFLLAPLMLPRGRAWARQWIEEVGVEVEGPSHRDDHTGRPSTSDR